MWRLLLALLALFSLSPAGGVSAAEVVSPPVADITFPIPAKREVTIVTNKSGEVMRGLIVNQSGGRVILRIIGPNGSECLLVNDVRIDAKGSSLFASIDNLCRVVVYSPGSKLSLRVRLLEGPDLSVNRLRTLPPQ